MSVADIANDLVALCRAGKNLEAVDKYYADDIVSVESAESPEAPAVMKGIQAVRGKNAWWLANHEVHSGVANGPYVGENQFAVEFVFDFTNKPTGNRMQMSEMALYTVKDGKIVHERFYYNPGATPSDWL
jgi:ketosteroid isomerase-like protein